ncbi:MAG: hypothetical protein JWP01_2574 [Myxococcales bacterium]|nr:hypothetical protein [Myxococcales bacterium]
MRSSSSGRFAAVTVVVVVWFGVHARSASAGDPPRQTVSAVALPAVSAAPSLAWGTADAVAKAIARGRGGELLSPARGVGTTDLTAAALRAESLAQSAAFDEAAATFDLVLRLGAEHPGRISNPSLYVRAHVGRAELAVARQEDALARSLVERLLTYDVGFRLSATAATPGLLALFDAVVRQTGSRRRLDVALLGAACRDANLLVVVRSLGGGAFEVGLYDSSCRVLATTDAGVRELSTAVAQRLLFEAFGSDPIVDTTPSPRRSAFRSPWFWAGTGAAVALSVAAWFLISSEGDRSINVIVHGNP